METPHSRLGACLWQAPHGSEGARRTPMGAQGLLSQAQVAPVLGTSSKKAGGEWACQPPPCGRGSD